MTQLLILVDIFNVIDFHYFVYIQHLDYAQGDHYEEW